MYFTTSLHTEIKYTLILNNGPLIFESITGKISL